VNFTEEEPMKRAFLAILLVMLPATAFATAQFGDKLIYKGETVSLRTNPLGSYFGEGTPNPKDLFKPSCSACWRGYVATWEVKDGKLFLNRVVEGSCSNNAPEIPLEKIFPGKKGPIEATWYTGTLRIPRGKMLEYVHMGYSSRYEKTLLIHIEKGKVTKEELIDNTKKNHPKHPKPKK
jgi:hypothetical protein